VGLSAAYASHRISGLYVLVWLACSGMGACRQWPTLHLSSCVVVPVPTWQRLFGHLWLPSACSTVLLGAATYV
jgi:hypothetical protein